MATAVQIFIDMWITYQCWGAFIFAMHITLHYIQTYKVTLNYLVATNVNVQNSIRFYSELRVISTVFNATFGRTYLPNAQIYLAFLVCSGIFIAVKLTDSGYWFLRIMGVNCSISSSIILVVFIAYLAMVSETSLRFRSSLKQSQIMQHTKEMRKLFQKVKVESITIGNFYIVEQITCLTGLGILSNICGSLLITIQF